MPVGYTRPEVSNQIAKWNLIRDCLGGAEAVKARGKTYLPIPNEADTSQDNLKRYQAYLQRAVYYNVTRRTLDGLVGQVFSREPVVEIPEEMDVLKVDVDGAGVSLEQQAKKALAMDVAMGRGALLVDYPPARLDAEGNPLVASQEDIDAGYVRPTITLYEPWEVINWRTVTVGARRVFSLIVISEFYVLEDDGFEARSEMQFRVLRLVPPPTPEGTPIDWTRATYRVEIWRLDSTQQAEGGPQTVAARDAAIYVLFEQYDPTDADGNPLREIPFTFFGALNNDAGVDHPPLYDLAVLNVAHYRNSADYEESCFLVGQPTPVLTGLTQAWLDANFKQNGQVVIPFGSRSGIPLPTAGDAKLLQAAPNPMPFEAMQQKERQMVALGAKLVEQKQVQRTATEAAQDDASSSSLLSSIARNVSGAYTQCLRWCALFMGASFAPSAEPEEGEEEQPDKEIAYRLNTDFPAARMTPDERRQLMAEWQAAAIARSEYRNQLRVAGVATLTDEQAKEEIDRDPPSAGFSFEAGGGTAPPDGSAEDDDEPPAGEGAAA